MGRVGFGFTWPVPLLDILVAVELLRAPGGGLRDLIVPGRLMGVRTGAVDLGGLKVLVEARKSMGAALSLPELELGLELNDRIGGPIEESL